MDENIEAECDEEIARISSQASIEDKDGEQNVGDSGGGHERPMSWDGLSDNDAIVSVLHLVDQNMYWENWFIDKKLYVMP